MTDAELLAKIRELVPEIGRVDPAEAYIALYRLLYGKAQPFDAKDIGWAARLGRS